MDLLNILEQKIVTLIDIIRELKTENTQLIDKNAQLTAKLGSIENSILSDTKRLEELDQEKALTKMVVDDLIKRIDSIMRNEEQQ
jgi:cell division septum initiation protein DivIVA